MIRLFDALKQRGIKPGTIAVSKAGHDRYRVYLVIRVEDKYAFLTDGRLRPLEKLKKKNIAHLRLLGQIEDEQQLQQLSEYFESGQKNAAIRKMIDDFIKQNLSKEEI